MKQARRILKRSTSHNKNIAKKAMFIDNTEAELNELWHNIIQSSHGKYWLSFPPYLLYWLSTYNEKEYREEYRNLASKITIHELRVPLKPTTKIIEGKSDIRRFLWVEEDSILSFGIMFDEYASQNVSYLAYLEKSEHGSKGLLKPILRSYAEFVSLISPTSWVLHIWADALVDGENYLFRNAKHPVAATADNPGRSKELKEKYQRYLQQSGFEGLPYCWEPILPPLPEFGKKREEDTLNKYSDLKENITLQVKEFNKHFHNTLCTKLEVKHPINPIPCYSGSYDLMTNDDKEIIDNTFFSENEKFDFSTRDKAKKSTKELLNMLCRFRSGKVYFRTTLQGLNCTAMKFFYEDVLSFVRRVQKAT